MAKSKKKKASLWGALRSLRLSLHLLYLKLRVRETWSDHQSTQGPVFRKRTYAGYVDYVQHQRFKLKTRRRSKDLKYNIKYRAVLRERLETCGFSFQGKRVLCLGARTGGEVRAFLDLGAFAVGIDLNPGKENRYVLTGDFHDIQFPKASVDVVFTNALDHVLYVETFIAEIQRVLAPGGLFMLEAVDGRDKRTEVGFYESFWWDRVDDLVTLFERSRFRLGHRCGMEFPYRGEHLLFIREATIEKPKTPQDMARAAL